MKNTLQAWLLPMMLIFFVQLDSFSQQNICEGVTKNYIVNGPGSGPAGSTYTWGLIGDSAPNYGGTPVLSTVNVNSITINWGTTPPGTYTLQVIETNNSCTGAPENLTIVISEPPVAGTISGIQSICQGGSTTFSVTGNSAAGTWSSNNTGIATVNSSGLITAVGVGTTSITYTVVGTGGCPDATATRIVTVTAPPVAGTISGTQAICQGGSTTFTVSGNSAGGVWSSNNSGIATVNSSGVISAVGAGTATITYTVAGTGGCPNATSTRNVTVTAPAVAGNISGIQVFCEGGFTSFSVSGNSAAGTWSSSNTSIATVSSLGVITAVGAGTATITYTVAGTGGCPDAIASRNVTVTAPAVAGAISGIQVFCEGSSTTFSVTGNSATGTWSSDNTSIATVSNLGVVTPIGVGTATIIYTVVGTGGCPDATTTRTVTINALPSTSVISFD